MNIIYSRILAFVLVVACANGFCMNNAMVNTQEFLGEVTATADPETFQPTKVTVIGDAAQAMFYAIAARIIRVAPYTNMCYGHNLVCYEHLPATEIELLHYTCEFVVTENGDLKPPVHP